MTGCLTVIGTATTLLSYGGITVLTDPNFLHRGQRAYLGKGLWSVRRTEPARQPADLPPLDAVVLSHLHGDHFDRVARRELPRDLPILTTRHAARRLRLQGFHAAVALDTWQTHDIVKNGARLRVTAAPGRHARGPLQAALPAVMGSVLEFFAPGEPDLSVYITGDTLLIDDLRELPARHPHLDLGIWHLGGTRIPFGIGMLVTMDGVMGADLLEIVDPARTVPVHHDDYGVFASPRSEFLAECARRGLSGVRPVERGETVPLPLP
ncbi:MAG TPA: MBL fold metallo-hydrolase [Mycobacteriales bacterium]|jgi:L-ascorbate metabolism protein UlaG (beta-lactamase superfamily)|nr:MBL fold metallo-hydrolase [Mycobacteriales bacterium]